MIKDLDWFPQKVIKVGGSLMISIPNNNAKFSGVKEGDMIKVYYRKIKEVKENGNRRSTESI